ncbi:MULTISPECIES: hypothetical protein [Acinetobacter]|uniref:Cold-shock protein n=1 Tax=Acinetobacter pseudolwoffii TaxID=2053287 RepID=A0A2H9YTQ2_9GAMM|nr:MULTISPECIES: hypothetical protein [Acinetobacter]PJO76049.1 hypothetical protein CWI32_06735 [Acinetobacter pseudolwoffii]
MFRNGKIKTYDSERGTGSIELADDAQELSFRLQDLPSLEIDPQIGELLKFRMIPHQETIILDNMVRLDVKVQDEFVAEVVALPSLAPTISVPLKRSILFSPTLWLALVSAVGFIILGEV